MAAGHARSRPAPDRSGAGPTRRGEPPAGVSAASDPATRVGTGKPVFCSRTCSESHCFASSAGGAFNPWKNEITVEADADHSYLGLITMIAPSPDWFTGASAIELYDAAAGKWKDTIAYDARAYDAGTDSGATFTAADAPENPPKPVSVIACDGKAFCDSGAIKPVAAIKITKL